MVDISWSNVWFFNDEYNLCKHTTLFWRCSDVINVVTTLKRRSMLPGIPVNRLIYEWIYIFNMEISLRPWTPRRVSRNAATNAPLCNTLPSIQDAYNVILMFKQRRVNVMDVVKTFKQRRVRSG